MFIEPSHDFYWLYLQINEILVRGSYNRHVGILYCVWYPLRLPLAFSYNALGFRKENLTQNISVRKNKVRLDKHDIYLYVYILHIIAERDKVSQTI